MAHLLEQLKQESQARRAEAARLYRDLLTRADAPQPGDREALEEVFAVLGIDAETMAADLAAMAEADRLRGSMRTPEQVEAARAKAHRQREAATQKLRDAMKAAIDTLDFDQAVYAYTVLHNTTGRMERNPAFVCGHPDNPDAIEHLASQHNAAVKFDLWKLAVEHPLAFGDPGPRPWNPRPDHSPAATSTGFYQPAGKPHPMPDLIDPVTGQAIR